MFYGVTSRATAATALLLTIDDERCVHWTAAAAAKIGATQAQPTRFKRRDAGRLALT